MKALILFALACLAVVLATTSDDLPLIGSDDDGPQAFDPQPAAGGGTILFEDTGAKEEAEPLWGAVDCDLDDVPPEESGPFQVDSDGDPALRGDGTPQGDQAFRVVRIHDGDDFFGERCELGENDSKTGPTAVYRDGERVITYASFRLPPTFPINTTDWQGVLQIKQTQPADNADGTPVLSLGAYGGKWILFHSGPRYTEEDEELWSVPAVPGVWSRFQIDTTLSADPKVGRVTVRADLDGDASFEQTSPTFEVNTLKAETEGDSDDGYAAGDPLVSHLRVGLYHNPVIPCPSGCHLDIDNVQVVRP